MGWLTCPNPSCKLTQLGSKSLHNTDEGLLCTRHCVFAKMSKTMPHAQELTVYKGVPHIMGSKSRFLATS